MYAGHTAIALFGSALRPRVPLAVLIFASQGSDWLQLIVQATLGGPVWRSMTVSHTIPGAFVLSVFVALLYATFARDWRGAVLVGAVTFSHVFADFFTGDKPLLPNGHLYGLGLYDHPFIDLAIEVPLVIIGWVAYRRSLPPVARRNRLVWITLGTLLLGQAGVDLRFAIRPLRKAGYFERWGISAAPQSTFPSRPI
jgi:hypothetical protein